MKYYHCHPAYNQARRAFEDFIKEHEKDCALCKITEMWLRLLDGDEHYFVVVPVNIDFHKLMAVEGIIDIVHVFREVNAQMAGIQYYINTAKERHDKQYCQNKKEAQADIGTHSLGEGGICPLGD